MLNFFNDISINFFLISLKVYLTPVIFSMEVIISVDKLQELITKS